MFSTLKRNTIKEKELDFGSYKIISQFENSFNEFVLDFPCRYSHIMKSQEAVGDNISNSKMLKILLTFTEKPRIPNT